jgi:adenosylhomocysteine nucleosidase
MAIGIISAMREEMQTLLESLQQKKTYTKGMRTYYQGTLLGKDVVLVFSRWGKVASSTTATQLINDFDIEEIIFTGVAGAIIDKLEIGDIVIGKNLYQYDVDARPFFKKFEVPILQKQYFETSLKHRKQLELAAKSFVEDYHNHVCKETALQYNITEPSVLVEDIASGDQFISEHAFVDKLNQELPTVNCVEMEGAAVAQVCFEYGIPFSIIRIISDKANDNAHIEFQKFANDVATHYTLGILSYYFEHAGTV